MRSNKSKVTILVVTKNEGEGIRKILRLIKHYADEVIVIDGHSTDNTKKIVKQEGIRYVLDNGKGRGDGVKVGIEHAKNDILLFFDGDGSHQAKDIPKLLKPIMDNRADLVIASRRTGGSFDLNLNFTGILRSGGVDFLAYLVNKRFHTSYSDIVYSFRAIRKPIAKKIQLKSNGFCIEQEMVISCLHHGFRVVEIPSREKARMWGKSKLRTIAGIQMLFFLLKDLYT